MEVKSALYWTPKLQATFRKVNGYDLSKYAMFFTYDNGLGFGTEYPDSFLTDGSDKGSGYNEDYRNALTFSLATYYRALTDWSKSYLGAEFSGQIGYGLPVDGVSYFSYPFNSEDANKIFRRR